MDRCECERTEILGPRPPPAALMRNLLTQKVVQKGLGEGWQCRASFQALVHLQLG